MARTALSFAGAAIGFFIGGPAGARWGWAIGSVVGGIVDPQVIQGPKIGETAVQTSRDGVPRAIVYGTAPVVGNIIARGALEVVKTRQRQGKGGGPVVESEEAYLTFAVRICEGPIQGVLRIWEDEKLVYDARPTSSIPQDSAKYAAGFTLYLGDETQLPDPELEAIYGVGDTPAYRGSAYIVFRRKNVTDRRGSVPQLRFEVSSTDEAAALGDGYQLDFQSGYTDPYGNTWTPEGGVSIAAGLGHDGGSCLVCDGSPGAVVCSIPPDSERQLTRTWVMEFWVWPDTNSTNRFNPPLRIQVGDGASCVSGSGGPLALGTDWVFANGVYYWRICESTTNYAAVALAPQTWTRFRVTKSASTIQVQVGDSVIGSVPISSAWKESSVEPVSILIGGIGASAAVESSFKGRIDNFSLVFTDVVAGESGNITLRQIVEDVCERCALPSSDVDATALTDGVDGLVLAGAYSGADAIRALQRPFFFDPCETDGKLKFVKRGGAVSVSLTDDDLIDADQATREQEVEYPRKMHLAYQHANSGYVPTKATIGRSSPDIRVVGEVTVEVPVVLSEDAAAKTCDKMMKVAWVDAKGEVKFSVSDQWLALTATDCIHLTRRGATRRLRIEKIALSEGVLQVEAREDRQSAYTSNLTGLQLPSPTPPPSEIPGETHFEFLNIPALRDEDDRLGYYVGAGQILSTWGGAVVELSVGDSSDFSRILTVNAGTVFGTLTADLPAAAAEVTDDTNTIHIEVNDDVLETAAQVLNEKNACAIVSANGTEILQFTTANLVGENAYELTGLIRGGLNTTPVLHASGARFVLLDTAYFVPAGSSLIGAELFHRATSYGNNPDESTVHQDTFSPANTQREWPVYGLTAARDGSDNVTVSWMPRHRLGTAIAPVPSVNFDGWQITFEKSGTSKNYFISAGDKQSIQSYTYTAAQATADLGSATGPINITVAQLNRITGAGETSQVSA